MVRLTDLPDRTIDNYRGPKTTTQLKETIITVNSRYLKEENLFQTPFMYRKAPWSSGQSGSVMVQKVALKCAFEAGLRHATTGKLFPSSQQ